MENSNTEQTPSTDHLIRLFMLVVESWATTLEVFFRSHFGSQYLGLRAVGVLVLIPFYCTLCQPFDIRPMLLFLCAFLGMTFMHRCNHFRQRLKGNRGGHTRYNGWPRMGKFFPRMSEVTIKQYVEPILGVILGFCCLPISPPLGLFWIIGAMCMFSLQMQGNAWEESRAAQMNDAILEQEAVAERFREIRGERF